MATCEKCAKLGSDYWEPESESSKQPAEGKIKIVATSLPTRRGISLSVTEDLEVVEDFGLRVRQAREKLGLNHEELGRKIGEKVSVLRKIESGRMVPDQKIAAKLEHALRIKLLVPVAEPETAPSSSPPSIGVTLGEIVHLKGEKRRRPEDESNHSPSERPF